MGSCERERVVGPLNRRQALKAVLGGTAVLAAGRLFGSVPSGYDVSQPIVAEQLSRNVAVFTGAGGNVVAARGSGGLALVDGGFEVRSAELLERVLRETALPRVDVLFNTHWHRDRTGLNALAGDAGARIVAHENTRLWLGTEITRPWDDEPFAPLPENARPNDTFYTQESLALGDQPVEYGYMLQSHTDGDIYVHFPEENVLVAGGVVSSDGWPIVDWWTGGWILGLVDGLDRLIEVSNDRTRVVPGSGPLLTRSDLEAQREMFMTIYRRLAEMFFESRSPAEAVAANPTEEFRPDWGDPSLFVTRAFQSLWPHFTPDV